MKRAIRSLVVAAILLACGAASAQLAVTVEGSVVRPGAHALPANARLLDAVRAAGVRPDAYLLGAAWRHRDEIASQRELKTGLLFDLAVLEQGARLDGDADLAALAARLGEQLRAMPVTGRRVNTLDPVRLELEPRSNRPLADGDRLLFPPRPHTVTVTGAVRGDCALPFVGLRPATAYSADCRAMPTPIPTGSTSSSRTATSCGGASHCGIATAPSPSHPARASSCRCARAC